MLRGYEAYLKDVLESIRKIKKIPDEIKSRKPEVEWKKIAGLRDILML